MTETTWEELAVAFARVGLMKIPLFAYGACVQGQEYVEDWRVLFKFYNEAEMISKGRRPVGMGCRPCFYTVYSYVDKYLSTGNNV